MRADAIAIVAHASSDGDGYRGAGVRLTAGGAADVDPRCAGRDSAVQAYTRRLRFARFLDRTLVGGMLFITCGLVGLALSMIAR